MNREQRRKLKKEKGKDVGKIIADDRKQLLMLGMITSLEILKNDFNFTEEQLKKFSDRYLPELENQMQQHS